MYCKIITTVSLVNIHHLTKQLLSIQYSIVNYMTSPGLICLIIGSLYPYSTIFNDLYNQLLSIFSDDDDDDGDDNLNSKNEHHSSNSSCFLQSSNILRYHPQ